MEQTEVKIMEKIKLDIQYPPNYNVIFHNDNFTTMDFVVRVLIDIFHHSNDEAHKIMMSIHQKGHDVVGTYPHSIAITKRNITIEMARSCGFPLRVTVEKNK
jgi:ATP-dependent Clp protease adaptor protein ClpS